MPTIVPGVGWSDHWSFWQHGYPTVMFTDTLPSRFDHYHTVDKIRLDRMARVVEGIDKVVADLAATP